MRELPLWLAGEKKVAAETIEVLSPYDRRVVSRVGRAGGATLAAGAAATAEAAEVMAALGPERRAALLARASELVDARREEFAQAISEEAGKPITLARLEVSRALDTMAESTRIARHPEVAARDLAGYGSGAGSLALIRRVPLGPVLAITPFNFPLNLVVHKVAPAVAAGCPVLVKPASQTPSPALLLAEVFAEAGLPAGGLSVLPCCGADAAPLVDDTRFRLLTFTGSGEVGWELKRQAWDRRVGLELGGNAAVVIEPDAGDLDALARKVAVAAHAYAGQSCIAVQRIFVHAAIAEPFREALVAATESLATGDPAEEATLVGPMIDPANADRVARWIGEAVEAGGSLLAGGQRDGQVIRPALLEGVPRDQAVVAEEVFGPVAVLESYEDFDAALDAVNDSRYGLQAGILTGDVAKVRRAWERLEVGGVIQGDVPTWRSDPMPYGGVKASGIGREGPEWAYHEMTEERLLVLR